MERSLFWKVISDLILRLICCFATQAKNERPIALTSNIIDIYFVIVVILNL